MISIPDNARGAIVIYMDDSYAAHATAQGDVSFIGHWLFDVARDFCKTFSKRGQRRVDATRFALRDFSGFAWLS